MTEVVRTKVKSIYVLTSSSILMFVAIIFITLSFVNGYGHGRRQKVDLLQFGSKCTIPRLGGEVSIECDASKGLICDGKACVCTFSDQFSYDPHSDECRKKLGKSCRLTRFESEHLALPFHQKCHTTAMCRLVSRAIIGGDAGSSRDGFSMCVCQPGWEPTNKLDGCRVSRPSIDLVPLKDDSFYDD